MKAIICAGISGSGKSTFASELCKTDKSYWESNRDTIRKTLIESDGKDRKWSNWNWKRESEVSKIQNDGITNAKEYGWNLIISDTNLNETYRNTLIEKLEYEGYEVEVKLFPIDFDEAVKRDLSRTNPVGYNIIAKQYESYIRQFGVITRYIPDNALDDASIFDLDGTLANMTNRSAYQWDKVGSDAVHEHVKLVLKSLITRYRIIIMSGRDSICRELTEKWLYDNDIDYDLLLMRSKGDMRDDRIIKSELFWEYVAPKYSVISCFDDRPKVCDMWRDIGLNVFQCGNPNVRF